MREFRINVVREAEFGGFQIQQTDSHAVLVCATGWKGAKQPRIVCDLGDDDWEKVLEERGVVVSKTLVIPWQDGIAADPFDQWLAH